MRTILYLFLFFSTIIIFSQKKVTKKFKTIVDEIDISTIGLDDFVIENSDSKFIEITLFAENANAQHIIFAEEYKVATIEFKIPNTKLKEEVFRKFITKRLQRASAIVKIPKNLKISIFGDNINITSKSCNNPFYISIEKGIVKMNLIQQNTELKMYAGNIFAKLAKTNINLKSNIGKIKVNDSVYQKKYQKNIKGKYKNFIVNSIKANIFLIAK